MQSESSSRITGGCVVFVYLVFTKGAHRITEVTTFFLKLAGARALFQVLKAFSNLNHSMIPEGRGDVANLLCLILVALVFFFLLLFCLL